MARYTSVADVMVRGMAAVSRRRRTCTIGLHAPGVAASDFLAWFNAASVSTDESTMLRACPDHYVIRHTPSGQQVLETTGGSPMPFLFTIDYDDTSSLVTQPDPQYPCQAAGVARASTGVAIGGVRHQFRDVEGGMEGSLTVEFPLPTAPWMLSGHRWHLACEFSNWVDACRDS